MIKNPARRTFLKKGLSLASTLALYGCGSGSGSSGSSGSSSPDIPKTVAPSIVTHPESQVVILGESAMFSVRADGSNPISYQWQRNNTDITGATSRTYTTPPVIPGDDARFSVVVSNSAGSIRSLDASLIVLTDSKTVDSTIITVDSTQLTVDSI